MLQCGIVRTLAELGEAWPQQINPAHYARLELLVKFSCICTRANTWYSFHSDNAVILYRTYSVVSQNLFTNF